MIHHYQKSQSLTRDSKTTQRRQKQISVKFDIDLANQVDFLATHLEIKKLEVLRKLVKQEITELKLWNSYEKAEKKYSPLWVTVKN